MRSEWRGPYWTAGPPFAPKCARSSVLAIPAVGRPRSALSAKLQHRVSAAGPSAAHRVTHPILTPQTTVAAAKTIRLLSTSACAVDGACTQLFKVVLVFGSRPMVGAIRGMSQRTRSSLYYKELSGRCTSCFTVNVSSTIQNLEYLQGTR